MDGQNLCGFEAIFFENRSEFSKESLISGQIQWKSKESWTLEAIAVRIMP